MKRTALTTVFVIPLLSLTALAVQSDSSELESILRERAGVVAELEVSEIWSEAQAIATLVGDDAGAAFDAACDTLLSAPDEFDGPALLFLSATRMYGEDIDYELIFTALSPVLDETNLELAIGAADLLGDPDLKQQDNDLRESIGDRLLQIAKESKRDPRIRIESALAAYQVGLGRHVQGGQGVLFDFLGSQDPDLRSAGALAMASIGVIEEVAQVESELARLASTPGPNGRLAAAYLKQLEIIKHKDGQLQRARERTSSLRNKTDVSPDLIRVDRLIDLIQQAHLDGTETSRDDLVEAALDGMLRSLDQHSSYFSPEAFKRFEQDLEAEYGGIGAYVAVDPEDNLFTITRPIYSGPAYKADLHTDDKIVQIDDWPTLGEEVDDIIKRLKGRPGTPVRLYIWRSGMDPSLIDRPTDDMLVTVERAQITIPPVHSDYLPGDIGYAELVTFSRVASSELRKRITDMKAQGMRAFILDLRNNTGGLLAEARNVADLFLPPGKLVVRTESRIQEPRKYHSETEPIIPLDMPVVVLINRFSASASEIVSGALQDHNRAVLVGQRSFGKGSVQNLFRAPYEYDDAFADENGNRRWDNWETITKDFNNNKEFDFAPRIKLTIERYLLPTGRSIHRELDEEGNIMTPGGVEPDTEVVAKRWQQWRLEEIRDIRKERKIRNWAKANLPGNEKLYEELAAGDGDDATRFPGLIDLYESLGTALPLEEVRFLARLEVRRIVQDMRGDAFPQGDYQEDLQLQEAIRTILTALGETVERWEPYAQTFDDPDPDARSGGPVVAQLLKRDNLNAALSLIAEAKEGNQPISNEDLRKLFDLIEDMENN